MFMLSLSLFVIGSSLCGLAWSANALIIFRVVQGIGSAFLLANAYLFGREYFALAATRFRSPAESDDLRQHNSAKIFFAGLFIAGFVMTPGLNLLPPLFGTAFMVRVHKMLSSEPR